MIWLHHDDQLTATIHPSHAVSLFVNGRANFSGSTQTQQLSILKDAYEIIGIAMLKMNPVS
jgi:hypothetical protein